MSIQLDLDFVKLNSIIESGTKDELDEFCNENNLIIENNKIKYNGNAAEKAKFWDKYQHIRKILLNATFGSLSNPHCRFFDKRIGQSITLTGRAITKHMISQVNKEFTGEYNHTGKTYLYGDTDSVYFSAYGILKDEIESGEIQWDKDSVTKLYDYVSERVNLSFADFMKRAFHCPPEFSKPIAAGREIIGTVGLFITKKRYAIMVYDDEGKRRDVNGSPGKVKAMGLDLRRSDTPKYIQEFLSEILKMVLTKCSESAILERIIEYRKEFRELPPWRKGTPKSINKITWYRENMQKGKKITVPGHVRAGMNWNSLRAANSDNFSLEIVDGMKAVVCKLKNNPIGYTSIAFPTDETRLPEWFKELPFDEAHMEETILDSKLDNLIGKLGYDLASTREINCFHNLFEF